MVALIILFCPFYIGSVIWFELLKFTIDNHRDGLVLFELLHDQLSRKDNAKLDVNPRRRLEANEQLLEVLLNYRIFLRQLSQIRFLFDYIALVQLAIMYAPPLLGRIHSPYVLAKVRHLIIIWTFYCCCSTLPNIFIVCRFSERCLRFYMSLLRLLAQAVSLTRAGQGQMLHFYDQHTLWILRQGLSQPEFVKERPAPHFMFVSFTFLGLIRLLFWYGLMLLSIAMECGSSIGDSFFDGLISDPLGVFQQPEPSWTLRPPFGRQSVIGMKLD